jgi:hypothetical protein
MKPRTTQDSALTHIYYRISVTLGCKLTSSLNGESKLYVQSNVQTKVPASKQSICDVS